VALFRLDDPGDLVEPILVAAFDGWVDAGQAATTAADFLASGGSTIGTFDADVLYDYRSRRPTLDIVDGRPKALSWPEMALRRARVNGRDVMVLGGHEPDFRWRELSSAVVAMAQALGVTAWIGLGAIPAAVPHTRAVTILGTESRPGLLRGRIRPGPDGLLRVPAAALSVMDVAVAEAGIPTLGYFAQVPHYISGVYPAAAVALLAAVAEHVGGPIEAPNLDDDAAALRERLDAATSADDTTRTYVAQLESMADESRLPAGDDLISDIERFLRDRGAGGTGGPGRS
jgi:PAC2 family protein